MRSDDSADSPRRARPGRPEGLWALAERALGSRADAEQFLTTPHALLDGRAPLELAATAAGAGRVEDLLRRLEHSLPV